MAYADRYPLLSGLGITMTQVKNFVENIPSAPEPEPLPNITKAKVVVVANWFYKIDDIGLSTYQIADKAGLHPSQVKGKIIPELRLAKADLEQPRNPHRDD